MADLVGQQFGNYRLTQLLGVGGFAEVYLAEHIHLGTQAAIKVLHTQLASDDLEKFRTEARTIARLIHPNIVRVLDFGIEDKTPFLVMDYANNGSLHKIYPRGTRLPASTIVNYVKQIASALQYAHDEKVIHRDIKPENMLLGRRNEVLLSDFGIALIAQSSHSQRTQDIVGTIAYMAPEHIQGKPRLASDQYALGVVVYEWICGDRPFHGSFTELCTQHMFATPPPLHDKIRELPPAVEEVVMTSLAKNPRERFGSMLAFATAFEQACQQRTPYSITPSSDNVSRSLFPPSTNIIAAPPPDRIAQTTDSGMLPAQTPPSSNTSIPPTVPAFYSPTPEAKPTPSPISSANFSTPILHATKPPVTKILSTATNKVPASLYINTPVPVQLPMPKRHTGWKISIGIVSLLLVVVLLFVLILHIQNNGQTIVQINKHSSITAPTPSPIATSTPTTALFAPKIIYVSSIPYHNANQTGLAISAIQTNTGTVLWQKQWDNESTFSIIEDIGGTIYAATTHFSSTTGYSDGGFVHALRASDGSNLWNFQVSNTNGAYAIYVSDGNVYVSASGLYVLQASTGSLLWKYAINNQYIASQPAVANGVVYLNIYDFGNHVGKIEAFRSFNGSMLWQYNMVTDVDGAPGSITFDNGVIYAASPQSFHRLQYPYDPSKDVQNTPSTVYALQAKNGYFLWKYQIDKDSTFFSSQGSSLESINGTLYAKSASQKNSNSAIHALSEKDGSLIWKYQVHVDGKYGAFPSILIADGIVYIASQGNTAIIYALGAKNGELLWTHDLNGGYDPNIVAAYGVAYLGIGTESRSQDHVDAVRVSDGSLLWNYHIDDSSYTPTLLATGTALYIGSYNYQKLCAVIALQVSNGSLLWHFPLSPVTSVIAAIG